MSTIDDLEPHATYKALMNLFDSEPDPYLKKSSNMRSSGSPDTGSTISKLGKLEQVKDALKFIIQEDYEEVKHTYELPGTSTAQ